MVETSESLTLAVPSFFEQPGVQIEIISIGPGVPLGIEQVYNSEVGIGGAYGSWGNSYDNDALQVLIEEHMERRLEPDERMNLSELGFTHRHHIPSLTAQEDIELEVQVGAQFLSRAAEACGWEPEEIEGVLIGCSGPVIEDFTRQIARAAGIPDSALITSIHKACDGAAAGLNLALNPELQVNRSLKANLADALNGKKVLVGGIEGLSRFLKYSHDVNALQLFGNGAGVIGIIPGVTMNLLASKTFENFDQEGVLQVCMSYPYRTQDVLDQSLLAVSLADRNDYRVAGLMHAPDNDEPVIMAGLMGMVKLFVRTGVDVVREVHQAYVDRLKAEGRQEKSIAVGVVHHANLKINKLKEKHLLREGISVSLPWVMSEFGNTSAASVMIAFLRQLPDMHRGDHILIDGFGAGTYYDTMVVELGGVATL